MPPPLRRERPTLPEGYGLPATDDGLLEWSAVEARLVATKHYWMATVRPDGRPHLIPRWGVWVDDAFYYDGSHRTRHARNAEANPACSLSLEDGQRAVILDGTSQATRADADGLGDRLTTAFEKYHDDGYAPKADAWAGADGGGLRVFRPATGMAWFSFPLDATRFVWSANDTVAS
ncbi:pyridoxamine 5'-phosphate oxidase family protein [soil metagenome]